MRRDGVVINFSPAGAVSIAFDIEVVRNCVTHARCSITNGTCCKMQYINICDIFGAEMSKRIFRSVKKDRVTTYLIKNPVEMMCGVKLLRVRISVCKNTLFIGGRLG